MAKSLVQQINVDAYSYGEASYAQRLQELRLAAVAYEHGVILCQF
ncbi:hypothetical protein [Nostoc sp.]